LGFNRKKNLSHPLAAKRRGKERRKTLLLLAGGKKRDQKSLGFSVGLRSRKKGSQAYLHLS